MTRNLFVVHRHDPRNIGDMSCAPTSYLGAFPWLSEATTIDIETQIDEYADRLGDADVIYGGGGLLGTGFFDKQLTQLMELHPRRLACWGAGHNNHDERRVKLPGYMDLFDLIGVRDWQSSFRWVPCVSAMIPELESPAAPEHEVVIYRHWDDNFAGLLNHDHGFPVLRNNVQDLVRVLDFLASGRLVATNSYHGAYWATLMGRPVVIVSPFSSKFYGLRWGTPIVTEGDWLAAAKSQVHFPPTSALATCREINRSFGEQVRHFFGR